MAIQIERKYTKDEILESYLNVVYFGHGAYGVEAASQIFFQKSVSEVNLQEAALLAAIVNGPGYYSPFYDMEAAQRRNLVLRRMLDLGFIDRAAYDEAVSSPIELKDGRRQQPIAPHFVIYVREQLLTATARRWCTRAVSGCTPPWTSIYSGPPKRRSRRWCPSRDRRKRPGPTAGGSGDHRCAHRRDPSHGGGRNNDQYNRAVQATCQPGSAMKPFVYAAAIDSKRYTPAHLMVDEPTTFTLITGETWTPRNYDNTHRGTMSLRTALEDSINVVAAKLIDEIGPATVIDYAKRMGITTLQESGRLNDLTLSFALGGLTRGVTLLEMATAYGVFASGGIRTTPIAILRVEGPDGTVIDEFRPQRRLVLSPETAYIMTDMMRGVIERGTGVGANMAGPPGQDGDHVFLYRRLVCGVHSQPGDGRLDWQRQQ